MKCIQINQFFAYSLTFAIISSLAIGQKASAKKTEGPISEYLAIYKVSGEVVDEAMGVFKEGEEALKATKTLVKDKPFNIVGATALLKKVAGNELPAKLAEQSGALIEILTKLGAAHAVLKEPYPKQLTPEQLAAIRGFAERRETISGGIEAFSKVKAALANSLGGVPEKKRTPGKNDGKEAIPGIPDALVAHLGELKKPLVKLNGIHAQDQRLTLLNPNADLSALINGITSAAQLAGIANLKKEYEAVQAAYKPEGRNLPAFPDTKAIEKEIEELISGLANASPSWIRGVHEDLVKLHELSRTLLQSLQEDPSTHSTNALGQVRFNLVRADLYDKLGKAGDDLHKKMSDAAVLPKYRGSSANELGFALTELKAALPRLLVTNEKLGVEYPVNLGKWTPGEIKLFYVEDVPRLIKILAGDSNTRKLGGLEGSGATAEAARQALDTAAMDVVNARADLSNSRSLLEAAQIELEKALRDAPGQSAAAKKAVKKARDEAKASTDRLREMTLAQDKTKADLKAAERALVRAQESKNETAISTAKSEVDRLTHSVDLQQAEIDKAKLDDADLQAEATRLETADSEQVTVLKTQVTELQGKVDTAQTAVYAANSTLNTKASNAYLAAQVENRAFAKDRDNGVYYASVPSNPGSSTDPVQRVYLYGSPNSKTLFIRGAEEDVNAVKSMVAEMDRPGAQAMMTVYTLEIGAIASSRGIQEASKAMSRVDTATDLYSLVMGQVTSAFRNSVSYASQGYKVDTGLGVTPARTKESRAGSFYHEDTDVLKPFESVLRLPDPTRVSTLAEALMITVLAKDAERNEILKFFGDAMAARPNSNNRVAKGIPAFTETRTYIKSEVRMFEYLQGILGVNGDHALVAGLRQGLVQQLKFRATERATESIYQRLQESKRLDLLTDATQRQIDDVRSRIEMLKGQKDTVLESRLTDLRKEWIQTKADQKNLIVDTIPLAKATLKSLGVGEPIINRLLDDADKVLGKDNTTGALQRVLRILNSSKPKDWYEQNHAKTAKVNEGLITLIRAFDDDVRIHFVNPGIKDLEDDLRKMKLAVGIFQRTSILASNRLVAKVDTQATASMEMGKDQGFLADSLQLARLFTANPAPSFGGSLEALGGIKEDRKPATIYGINSGGVFQVTPVFDPTGQALRFRFDYVMANQVREPNGTVDPQLPRIERHSVNTEVRLSNYEIRNVSKFNTNGQLGLPTRKAGGLPIFKDLYPFSEIPLIGWFTRREGRSASIQQSVILTQTSMYPTVQDIIELLTSEHR